MTVEQLRETLPGYAKDLKLNLGSLLTDTVLTEQQRWGALLATALAARNPKLIEAISTEAAAHLTPEAVAAAKSAASIMAMNNIYYRFTHLASDRDYATMPARLRMNVIANPGVEKLDFELWSLAVSAVNGCGRCIEAHEDVLLKAGMSKEAIQDAIRIAAIVFSVSVTLEDPAIADEALKAAA